MPGSWQGGRPGYPVTGMSRHRDPVRGFPPTPGARDPQYRPSHAQARNGTQPGAHNGQDQVLPTADPAGPDVLSYGRPRPDTDGGRDPAAERWGKDWGGGPWETGSNGGPWVNGSGNGYDAGAFAGGANGSKTWTDGEDEPTQIWTLRRHGEDLTGFSRDEAGAAAAREPARIQTGLDPSVTGVATPTHQRDTGRTRTRRGGGRSRVLLVAALAVVAAIALAFAAIYAFTSKHKMATRPSAKPVQAQPSLPSQTPSANLGKWQYISSRVDDPAALTLAELYPAQVSAGPRSYFRTAQRASRSCRSAVFGSRLKAAVRTGCSRALRASYQSVHGKRMATMGVLDLATSNAAAKVGRVVKAPGQFIQPLPGPHGAARKLGEGIGVVWAVAKGHYLILTWAQYGNLRSPATASDRKVLQQFVNDLYQKTINQSLTRRMVTGKPLTP